MAITSLTENLRWTEGGKTFVNYFIKHSASSGNAVSVGCASLNLTMVEAIIGYACYASMKAVTTASDLTGLMHISINANGAGLEWQETPLGACHVTVMGW